MNVSSVSAYKPYIEKITSQLDSQSAAAQQSIDELHRLSASYEIRISDYGMVQSDLSNLQSAAQKISGVDAFSLYSAKSSAPAILTASAQKNASEGTYNVAVNQLAQGQTLVSAAQQNPSAAIGSSPATVTFQFANGMSQGITIDKSNNTLPGIAASINQAAMGINASVVFNGSAFQLALSGPSGSSNAFSIGVSGDETLTRLLSYSDGSANNGMTQTMAAQDSQGSVNGTPFTGYSNVVTGVPGGLTLNLGQTGNATVSVSTDMAQITGAVQSFVDTFNRVQSDLTTYLTGELSGDRILPAIGAQLSANLSTSGTGSGVSAGALGQIGITRNQDGTLALDTTAFQNAYSRDPAGVARLFTDNGSGLADQISKQLQGILQPSGSISSTIDQLLTKIQGNQQSESRIEYNSIQDLQSSAHQYAQQLAMMIVTDIVNQFMQGASSQISLAPEKISGMASSTSLSAGLNTAMQPNGTPGVSTFEMLMNNLAPQYNTPSPALNTGNQA